MSMEIIKPGVKPETSKILECPKCRCIFKAEKGEYKYACGEYQSVEVHAECPFCGQGGYKSEAR